jgi:hypothetical protein
MRTMVCESVSSRDSIQSKTTRKTQNAPAPIRESDVSDVDLLPFAIRFEGLHLVTTLRS